MRLNLVVERRHLYFTIISIVVVGAITLTILNETEVYELTGFNLHTFNLIFYLCFYIPFIFVSTYKLYYRKIGNIDFDSDKILIKLDEGDNKEITLSESLKLRLIIDDSKRGAVLKLYYLKLSIEGNDNFLGEYNFLITKNRLEAFKKVLQKIYSRGIELREFHHMGAHAFKLNWALKYKDIQEIKNKYGISWYNK